MVRRERFPPDDAPQGEFVELTVRQLKGRIKRGIEAVLPDTVSLWRSYREHRAFRRAAFLETKWGFRLAGGPQMAEGIFEPAETDFVLRTLPGADAFIDIGANIGLYTLLARSAGKPVIAVEPHPDNLAYLLNNVAGNGWHDVEVFPLGLLAQPGVVPLYGGSTGASTVESWAGISKAWKRHIPVTTLDNLLAERFERQQLLIKMDVEGAEFEVLKGAAKTLGRYPRPVWMVEINFTEHFPGGQNPNFQGVFETFWNAGYTATSVTTEERVDAAEVRDWLNRGERRIPETNFVFR